VQLFAFITLVCSKVPTSSFCDLSGVRILRVELVLD